MAKPKSAISIFIEYAAQKGTILNFVNDRITVEAYPSDFYFYDEHTKILTIVTDNIPPEYKESIQEILRNKFSEEGLILKRGNVKELVTFRAYKKANTDGETIDFFKDKIADEDLGALKMSLFMRSEKINGKDIHKYKKAIRERFGERGTTIANLCNEKYFENEFIPLYNKVGANEFDIKYELYVGKRARALFINSGMNFAGVYTSFLSVYGKCVKYNLDSFRIHAFGNFNVNLIRDVVNTIKETGEKSFTMSKEESNNPSGIIYDIFLS